jgi:PAS domain-containing protein
MSDLFELPPLPDYPVLPGSDEDKLFTLSPTSSPVPSQTTSQGALEPDFELDSSFLSPSAQSQSCDRGSKDTKFQKISSRKVAKQERQEQRKVKHRLIDRKRRMREKVSIDELKDLVFIHPSEKPDKATIVAGAVKTIKDLQQQIQQLEARLPSSPATYIPQEPKASSEPGLSALLPGLAVAGVNLMVIDFKNFTVVQVNDLFEVVSGWRKDEILGRRFDDFPLFGRYVQGDFPRDSFMQSLDPQNSLIPTASLEDYTPIDLKRLHETLLAGGTPRVVCRWMTKVGYVLESYSTLCLWRGSPSQPMSIVNISTPEQRRFTIPPWILALPTNVSVKEEPYTSPLAQ